MAIPTLSIDVWTTEVRFPVTPHDSDLDPPIHSVRVPADESDGIGETTDANVDILVRAVLRGRAASPARTVDALDLDYHPAARLLRTA